MNNDKPPGIELSGITPEYKLHYLIRRNSNPIFEKDICNKYEQDLYDYYNLSVELFRLIIKRKFLIMSYFETQDKIETMDDFYMPNLFPCIREQIIIIHRKIQYNKNIILNNWNIYNNILNKYIIKYG